jgi:hypothetical protein
MPTLDTILTRKLFLDEFGGDEIVACDPRSTPRRRGTIHGWMGDRLWVEWFDSGRKNWIATNRVHDWKDRRDPIPRRGYVVRAAEMCIRAAEDESMAAQKSA